MFDLEKHLQFVKDVEENPEKYKPAGTEIYCSPNGISYWKDQRDPFGKLRTCGVQLAVPITGFTKSSETGQTWRGMNAWIAGGREKL